MKLEHKIIAGLSAVFLLVITSAFSIPTKPLIQSTTEQKVVGQVAGESIEASPQPLVPTSPIPAITPRPIPTITPKPLVRASPLVKPSPVINPSPTLKPSPIPSPTTQPTTGLSNDDHYTNSEGNEVHSPAFSNAVPAGASAKCGDGTYSFSQSRRGTCSHHGGVSQWL